MLTKVHVLVTEISKPLNFQHRKRTLEASDESLQADDPDEDLTNSEIIMPIKSKVHYSYFYVHHRPYYYKKA